MRTLEKIKLWGSLVRSMSYRENFLLIARLVDYYFTVVLFSRKTVVRLVNGYKMQLSFEEPGISKGLLLFRTREKAELGVVKKILKPGMRFLDIGANIGFYTILAAKIVGKNGKVYAYEPYPTSYNVLIDNIKLTGISNIVDAHNMAVADESIIKKLYLGKGSNVHSFSDHAGTNQYVEVPTIDINKLLVNIGEPVHLMRMDLEGYERQLFLRLDKTLANYLPKRIFFEIHPIGDIDPDPSFERPIQNMLELGYYPEIVISSANVIARERFEKLNYHPNSTEKSGLATHYFYKNIKSDDLLKVAATRPRITRSILLNREN